MDQGNFRFFIFQPRVLAGVQHPGETRCSIFFVKPCFTVGGHPSSWFAKSLGRVESMIEFGEIIPDGADSVTRRCGERAGLAKTVSNRICARFYSARSAWMLVTSQGRAGEVQQESSADSVHADRAGHSLQRFAARGEHEGRHAQVSRFPARLDRESISRVRRERPHQRAHHVIMV